MHTLKCSLLTLPLLLLAHIGPGQAVKKSEITLGYRFLFQTNTLEHPVEVFVGLPPNYDHSTCRYPVHYVLDGQILFSYYYGVADILTKGEIPECIVVGIQSINRGQYFKPGEGAAKFTSFIVDELIPYIDETYRTSDFRTILGHSTTGAFVMNMFLQHPGMFDIFIAGAPYHADLFSEESLNMLPDEFDRKKYFYSFYGLEDNLQEKNHWDSLADLISKKNIRNFKLVNRDYQHEGHYAIIFRYIPDGLKTAFSGWGYSPEPGGEFLVSDFKRHDAIQRSKFNVCFSYSEGYFISNAIKLGGTKHHDAAIQLLSTGLVKYPDSDVLHSIIASQYEITGNRKMAVEHYKKALALNPELDSIKRKLAELE